MQDVGMVVDKLLPNSCWSPTDRKEFGILEGESFRIRNYSSFFEGSKEYLKEVHHGATRNKIAELQEYIKETKDALPWE